MPDSIHIEQLELIAHIGVPDEERATGQRLTATLSLEPTRGFGTLADDIANAVDYFAICEAVRELVAERPRRLIETLAEEIAMMVLRRFQVATVEIEIRKYILADTRYVAVRVRRGP